jgi:hypothetical protein
MIHIVFNEPDVAILKQAIGLDETLAGDVVQIKDDYAVGPIKDIFSETTIEARMQWWRDVLAGGDYDGMTDKGEVNDAKTVAELKERLDTTDEVIWIWAAQNKHDVSGYYWLMSQFKDYYGKIFILYLNNLPFFNEKGNIFYPTWISEIPAKEFLKAKKLAREITLSEFEVDPDEWTKIANEDKGVRLLEGGKKLIQHDYDFYDTDLKKIITGDWQKGSKIIQQHLKIKETTGDAYLLWRLKQLLHEGIYDVQGKIANMKDFEVKRK